MSTPYDTADEFDETPASARPNLTRKQWVLAIVGVAALTAVAAWYGWGDASQPVRWQDVGFSVDSPTQASATFDVYLYTDQGATCYVHALNVQYAEVGVAQVDVLRSNGAEQRFTLPITTVEDATAALVRGCGPLE